MERRRPSLIGPLILITIGILFLMANTGVLPYSLWEIGARFWPLILILVGIDIIIGRHTLVGSLTVVILWIVLVGGVLWLAMNQGGGLLPTASAVSDQLSQPLGDVKSATVELDIGTARANIHALNSDTTNLLEGTFQHAQGTRVVKDYQVAASEGRLRLREEGINFLLGGLSTSKWDVGLYPQVPIALALNGGIGSATVDLSGLQVTSLFIDSGVGSVNATLPKTGVVTARLNGGVGSAVLNIPQGMSARIRVSAGLGGINVDQGRFPKFGEVYQSTDYATATNKVDVEIDGGLGSIRIQ